MTSALTSSQIALHRKSGQATRIFFAIPEYHVIYSAELSAVPTTNDMQGTLSFTNGSGTLGNVKADMTLYVGTTAGAYDLGMCRIRKAPIAGTFYIGEISEVEFDHGGTIYLTVVDDYGLWSKPVKIVSDVAKMDFDVDYSDQHENFDPIPVLGCHAVEKLEGVSVTVRLGPSSDTGSWVEGSSISSYLWEISGADSIDDDTAVNPNATFSAVGTYLAYCTVTAANGSSFQGMRYVIIWDEDHPLKEGRLNDFSYDFEAGGLSFTAQMFDALETDIHKRSLVIIVTEDSINGEIVQFAHPIQGRENIFGIGWIGQENITHNLQSKSVEFTVHNAANWFKNMEGYLSGIEFKVGTADDWTNMPELTVRRMLWHFLHWRTTATRVMDVTLTDDSKYAGGFKTITGGLWQQLITIASTSIFAHPGVDNLNRLFIEVESQMVAEASRTSIPEIMDMDDRDWIGEIHVLEELPRISMLYFSGISVDSSKNALAYVSLAPGHIHKRFGTTQTLDNYLVSSQSDSNQSAGLYLGWQNNIKEFEIHVASCHRMINIFPRQYINLTIDPSEDPRGVGYSGRVILRRIQVRHDPNRGILDTMHFYEPETFEDLAIDGDIPDGDGDYAKIPKFPPYKPIPLPPITVPLIPGDTPTSEAPQYVLIATSNFGILYTSNGNEADQNDIQWKFMNSGLTEDERNNIIRIVKTPSGALFAMTEYPLVADRVDKLYWCPGIGGEWSLLFDNSGLPGTNSYLIALGINPDVSEEIAVGTGSQSNNSGQVYTGNRDGVSLLVGGIDSRQLIGEISYGMNKWYMTHAESNTFLSQAWSRISAAGSLEVNTKNPLLGQTYAASKHYHKRQGGIIYEWNTDARYLRTVNDNDGDTADTTQPNVGSASSNIPNLIAVDPTGQYLMGGHSAVIGKRSTDYGVTWGNVDATLGIGYHVWECAGNASRFVTATTQSVKWTPDFGDTWNSMTGNLATIAALCDIEHVLYISG